MHIQFITYVKWSFPTLSFSFSLSHSLCTCFCYLLLTFLSYLLCLPLSVVFVFQSVHPYARPARRIVNQSEQQKKSEKQSEIPNKPLSFKGFTMSGSELSAFSDKLKSALSQMDQHDLTLQMCSLNIGKKSDNSPMQKGKAD